MSEANITWCRNCGHWFSSVVAHVCLPGTPGHRIAELERENAELRGRLVALQCAVERIRDMAAEWQELASYGELKELLETNPPA